MKYDFECVIVGAGIAGMTAAIYLKRAGVKVLLLDHDAPGGLLNKIASVENYPGYVTISGPELAFQIYEQVKNLNIEIRYGRVLEIKNHTLTTDIEKITTDKVLMATGRKARTLEDTTDLKNVSYCALCDGNLYKNKVVAVVGGGNTALEEALYLSNICKKVILIHRRDKFKGEESLQNQISQCGNIEQKLNCVINTINKKNNIITSLNTTQGTIEIDGLFVSIGYEPNNHFLEEVEKKDGYICVDKDMKTNVDYIYACGDSIQKQVYQLTTAVGEATIAAVQIKRDLSR